MADEIATAFHRSVDEGVQRLERSIGPLLATGIVGGLDVSVGVLALLVVVHETGNHLLGALAFGIGFLALTLANSELFTENFLVPITAVVARDAAWPAVLRLWIGTAIGNFIGGWIAMGLAMMAFPDLRATALEVASHPVGLGTGREALASAVLGGTVITLMTWMERGTESVPAKLASAWSIAFLLAAVPMQHAIVVSIETFAALHAGAPFGYGQWVQVMGWAALGNAVGGVGLVTMLRLVQVGRTELRREQARPVGQEREDDAVDGEP
jgi:formate/nitrite transporter FocA (FNT family)